MRQESREVFFLKNEREEIEKTFERIIKNCNGLRIKKNWEIAVKINLCNLRTPETGAVTDPAVLEAFIKALTKNFKGLKISIVESNATSTDADLLFKWLGFMELAEKHGIKCINLSKDRKTKINIEGTFLREIMAPKTLLEADGIICFAKLKTHLLTKISCCLKNQFGCLPFKRKIVYHRKLDEAIVDSNIAFKPCFCVVDGLISMETEKGPTYGSPRKTNLLIAGLNPVPVDSFCARIMGFNPRSIRHVRKAEEAGIGETTFKPKNLGRSKVMQQPFKFSDFMSKTFKLAYRLRGSLDRLK